MKRVFLICFLVFIAMLFAGCKLDNVNKQINEPVESKSGNVDKQISEPVESKSNSVTDYEVNTKEYIAYGETDKPFKVKYAQISGLSNESLESHINQTLKSSMTEWINEDCERVEYFKLYSVYNTPEYLSLCYLIEWDDPQRYVTRVGVTIDMQTGDRVYLDDIVKDIDNLKQKLVNYDYGTEFSPPISPEEADKIIHYASISEKEYFEELYKTNSHVYSLLISYLGVKPSFYLKDNKLVITRDRYEMNDIYIDF